MSGKNVFEQVKVNLSILQKFEEALGIRSRLRVDNHANPQQGLVHLGAGELELISDAIQEKIQEARFVQLYTQWGICEQLCHGCPYTKVLLKDLLRIRGQGVFQELATATAAQITAGKQLFEQKLANIIYNGGGTASLRNFDQSEIINSAISEVFDTEETAELNLEGNGSHFTDQKIIEEISLRNKFYPNSIMRWSVGGFGDMIAGRTEPVDSCLEAITRIKSACQKAGIKCIVNTDFVFGNTNFDHDKTMQNILNTLDKMFESGASVDGCFGQITTYGMRNSLSQEASIDQYLREYFETSAIINSWVKSKNKNLSTEDILTIELGPQTLGGNWFTIKRKSNDNASNFYIQDRWSMFDQLGSIRNDILIGFGNGAYSATKISDDDCVIEDICYIRNTAKPDIYNYLDNSSSMVPTTLGLRDGFDSRVMNVNYKTAQELHCSGRYYAHFTVGETMQTANRYLCQEFEVCFNEFGNEYVDISDDCFVGLRERLMSLLNENCAFDRNVVLFV
jgi:hypothetical protein